MLHFRALTLRALSTQPLQERHGSKMAFLDGAPPERLCQPLVDYFTAKGGEVRMNARLKDFVLNPDGSVKQLQLVNGETVRSCGFVVAGVGVCM